jgi:hypothetical protein
MMSLRPKREHALSSDNVHPNSTVGYPWMGKNWYGAIKSYLH